MSVVHWAGVCFIALRLCALCMIALSLCWLVVALMRCHGLVCSCTGRVEPYCRDTSAAGCCIQWQRQCSSWKTTTVRGTVGEGHLPYGGT